MGGLGNFYTEMNKGIGAATRIWEIIDRRYEIPVEGGVTFAERPIGTLNCQFVMRRLLESLFSQAKLYLRT